MSDWTLVPLLGFCLFNFDGRNFVRCLIDCDFVLKDRVQFDFVLTFYFV